MNNYELSNFYSNDERAEFALGIVMESPEEARRGLGMYSPTRRGTPKCN